MERRTFSQVLQNAGIDLQREYTRVYDMFNNSSRYSGFTIVRENFSLLPFKGRCVSFYDFNETYNFYFEKHPTDMDVVCLINFFEYCYNLCRPLRKYSLDSSSLSSLRKITNQIEMVLDAINYEIYTEGSGQCRFVEKNLAVTAVTEIVPDQLSVSVLKYNHHALKGDIEQKQKILKDMADYLEPLEGSLAGIDPSLKKNLFYLFNNFNIRHNNIASGKDHNILLDNMGSDELEKIYDDTFQLWLLAVLQLDNVERKQHIKAYRVKQEELKAE